MINVTILSMSDALNKGDLAILESTIGLLRKHYPACSISLFNVDYPDGEVDDPRRFHHLEPLRLKAHYGSFFPALFSGESRGRSLWTAARNLARCLVIQAGAAVLQNRLPVLLRGLDRDKVECLLRSELIILKGGSHIYSEGGMKQLLYLYRMLFAVSICLSLGKKVRALGHSFGPFRDRLSRNLAARRLRRLERIVVRDEMSYRLLLDDFQVPPGLVYQLPDLAFWTEELPRAGKESVLEAVLRREGFALEPIPDLKIGLTVREWHFPGLLRPGELFESYLRAVSEAVKELYRRHGARTFLMPHCRADLPVAREIARLSEEAEPLFLTGDYSTTDLRDLYGEMDLFIGTRIHSALFAFSRGTPVIAIAYEKPKASGIVGELLGYEAVLSIESVNARQLVQKAEQIFQAGASLRRKLCRRWEKLKEELENSLDDLFEDNELL